MCVVRKPSLVRCGIHCRTDLDRNPFWLDSVDEPPAPRTPVRLRAASGVAVLGAALVAGQAFAQVPNAGGVMRDIETSRPALPPTPTPELDIAQPEQAPEPASDTGPRVHVRAFALGGNHVFDGDTLLPLVADLAGRDLSFAGLQQAAGRITAYYRERGYVLARAYLPRQDIDDGVVRIEVVEGRFGKIELNNRSRVLDVALRQPVARLQPGDVVRGTDLERSLVLLDDLAGVAARGTLRAGAEAGTTDLVVDVDNGPIASGSLDVDNYGDVSTGRYRLGASVNVNSPLRLGDQVSLRGLVTDEWQRYYRVAYQIPVGPLSTRVGVAASHMRYRLAGEFSDLDYYGRASVQSAFVAQPLVRGRHLNITAQLQYEHKNLSDTYGIYDVQTDKHVGLWSFTLSGSGDDRWLGGGRSSVSVTFGVGRLRSNDALDMNFLTDAIGTFSRLNVSALRVQSLGRRFQLYTQFSGQLASRNLDSSEKFSLGGPYGVRAYGLGAGSGDQGWQASAELRYLAAQGLQLSTFVDAGAVQINKHPWQRESNTRHMQSAGIGAAWYGASRQITLTAAWPLGAAADSPTRAPSMWIQAAQYF